MGDGEVRESQVLEIPGTGKVMSPLHVAWAGVCCHFLTRRAPHSVSRVVIEVLGMDGVDITSTRCAGFAVKNPLKNLVPISEEILRRGSGHPKDGGLTVLAEDYLDVQGKPINPFARVYPKDKIQVCPHSVFVPRLLLRRLCYVCICSYSGKCGNRALPSSFLLCADRHRLRRRHELHRPWPEDSPLLRCRLAAQRGAWRLSLQLVHGLCAHFLCF